MSELSCIIMEISVNRSKLHDMAPPAMHLQCVKGAVSTTWRVEGLIWDMLEDVRAETRPRSLSILRTFLFSNHAVRANHNQTSTCANSSHLRLCLLQMRREASDLNREIILRIFRAFSAGDFQHFPLCPCRYVLLYSNSPSCTSVRSPALKPA